MQSIQKKNTYIMLDEIPKPPCEQLFPTVGNFGPGWWLAPSLRTEIWPETNFGANSQALSHSVTQGIF